MIAPNWTKLLTCAALPILTGVLWAGSPQSPDDPANSRQVAKVDSATPNSADPPASPLESPSTSDPLTAGQIQSLPMPRRNWESFVFDSSGPAVTAAEENSQTSDAGNRTSAVTFDGASLHAAFGDTTGRMPVRGRSLMGPSNEASIREVQSITRSADNGANIVTERGTNRLHGQGFVFDRQHLWSARNPFTSWVRETAPATLITTPTFTAQPYSPPDREWIWGAGLGGVLRRDRLFWFASIDGFQRTDPGVSTVKHPDNFFAQPSNDQMQVLSARLGLISANPVAAGVAAFSRMLETLDGLLGPAPPAPLRDGADLAASTGRPANETASRWKETAQARTHLAAD